jgi:OPA family glycerol-3-phosphate transporter-like MFS transporter
MVSGAASMDFGGRKAAATATGLIDGFQYLTSALNPFFLSTFIFPIGWQAWKLWPIPFALTGAVVMMFLWNTMPKGRSGH